MRFYQSLFLLLITSVLSAQAYSYEDGLKNCDSIKAELSKNVPEGGWVRLQADCLIGARIPDFTAVTMEGKKIDKDYFNGKVTLINFWMKTCGPCISEIPGMNKLKEEFGTDKVNFLAIGRCNHEDGVAFLQKYPFHFDQVDNGQPLIEDVFKFGWGYPVTMLVNKKGEIVMSFNGGVMGDSGQIVHDRLKPMIEAELAK